MARDANTEEFSTQPAAEPALAGRASAVATPAKRSSLPGKLLLLTILFVMLAAVLIFLPTLANYRVNWLMDRLIAAQIASLAADAAPEGALPPMLRDELLNKAKVRAVAIKRDDQRRLVLSLDMPGQIDAHYDLTDASLLPQIWQSLQVFFQPDNRVIRAIGQPGIGQTGKDAMDQVEIVLLEGPLKADMIGYALSSLVIAIIISVITATLIYMALTTLLVKPMQRIAANMQNYSARPEDQSRIIVPSGRTDEIGTTERELAHMQRELALLLNQKTRLAALGLAVSKINHDLRNMLASAQLISDRLGTIPDPTVQRLAPKLIGSLDRAIGFCNDTLRYGRAEEATPRRQLHRLRPLVEEVGEALVLPREGTIDWQIEIAEDLRIDIDREQLFRVLSNLCRNAVQAIEGLGPAATGTVKVAAWREEASVIIEVTDDGPGVPEKARTHLFEAFQGSTRAGGTGLGLAIAAELVAAHGGRVRLVVPEKGASFRVEIPDRA